MWFLGGTFTTVEGEDGEVLGIADRECHVPPGKALFFPLINAEAATVEGNGKTEAELRAVAEFLIDHVDVDSLSCTIDGVALKDLDAYRVQSPLFEWGPLPENNIFGDPDNFPAGTTSPAVSDGYFVMLAPLSAGEHTIHFTGSVVFTQEEDGFDFVFSLDITYHLTVGR